MRSHDGFMLVEIMLAILLSTLVMLGLYAIFSLTFSTQTNAYKKAVVQEGAGLSVKSILQDLEDSAHVTSFPAPPYPTRSDTIDGCVNWSNLIPPAGGKMDPLRPTKSFRYCLNAGSIYYYYNTNDVCVVSPLLPLCGSLSAPPWNTEILARNVSLDNACSDPMCGGAACANNLFCRASNNMIALHYIIGGAIPAITVNTSIHMMASQRPP